MTLAQTILLMVVVAAFAYPLYQRWQLVRTRADRDRLAELGKEILSSPTHSEDQKILVSQMLDDVLDWRFMAYAVVYFPVIAFRGLFGGERTLASERARIAMGDAKFAEFVALHQKSTMAANPMFALIFRIELAVILICSGVIVIPYLLFGTIERVSPRVHHAPGHTCRV